MKLSIEEKLRRVQQDLGKSTALRILKKNKKASVTVIRAGKKEGDHFTAGHVVLHSPSAANLKTVAIKIPQAEQKSKRVLVVSIDNG